ncbi:MAG: hypothetical protein MK212_13285 [Saprospiraceae bacterium]|nr:hypothetical protein [Saprospiraceae bacterium]
MKQLNTLIFLLSSYLIFLVVPQQLNAYAASGHVLSNTAVEQAPPVETKKVKKKKTKKRLRLKKKLFQKKPKKTKKIGFFIVLILAGIIFLLIGTILAIIGGFLGGWNSVMVVGALLLAISLIIGLITFITGLNAGGWGELGGWISMFIYSLLHFTVGVVLLVIGLIVLNPILWITGIIMMLELIILILVVMSL